MDTFAKFLSSTVRAILRFMRIREAQEKDLDRIMEIRASVIENRLSDPSKVTTERVLQVMQQFGFGLVYEKYDQVCGFVIVDLAHQNLWALFVAPEATGQGIGKALLQAAVKRSFKSIRRLWLTTDPGTRAERFYSMQGWKSDGMTKDGEMRFILEREP